MADKNESISRNSIKQLMRGLRSQGLDRLILYTVRYLSWKLRLHRRVRTSPALVRTLGAQLIMQAVRWQLRIFNKLFPQKYTTADPYDIIWVDPQDIKYVSGLHDKKRRGWVLGGDWDKNRPRFLDLPIPRSVHLHYNKEIPWEKTPISQQYDQSRFEQKVRKIEQLHDTISTEGYRAQTELIKEDPASAWKHANATLAPHTNEITVDIGRDGELLWNMLGKHRLSVAKVLEVDEVPVLVYSRHTEWQSKRHNPNMDSYGHPDIVS